MSFHQPVLLKEVIEWMNLTEDGIYCDCTVGGGGHLIPMLERTKSARRQLVILGNSAGDIHHAFFYLRKILPI